MKRASRLTLVALSLAGMGVTLSGLYAFAQQAPPPPREAPAKPTPPADDGDSAQSIEDDPTVAPDPEESADNNITFPIDV